MWAKQQCYSASEPLMQQNHEHRKHSGKGQTGIPHLDTGWDTKHCQPQQRQNNGTPVAFSPALSTTPCSAPEEYTPALSNHKKICLPPPFEAVHLGQWESLQEKSGSEISQERRKKKRIFKYK